MSSAIPPGIDAMCTAMRDEGAAYLAAWLANFRAGQAGADDLAVLLIYLKCGDLLAGACAELCRALHLVNTP